MENIIIEQHPDHPKDPTVLRLQLITRSPIENTVWFDRPRHEKGRVLLGPHADGIGDAFLRVYTKNRMHNSYTLGSTGSGKSRLFDTIAVTVRDPSFPPTVIFYVDGQNGASSPYLFQNATWSVGLDDALTMLSVLERVAAWRNRENVFNRIPGFTPTPERPGIMVIIDEQFDVFALAPRRWTNIAVKGNKLGISIHSACQDSNVKYFGNEDLLRSSLLAGTGLAMRVSSRIAGNLIPGLEFDPFDMPVLPGYGMTIIPPGSEGRTAGFRGRYSPDAVEAAEAAFAGDPVPVPTIEDWFERHPPWELDRRAARAAGADYIEREEIAERKRNELMVLMNSSDEEFAELEAAARRKPSPPKVQTARTPAPTEPSGAFGRLLVARQQVEIASPENQGATCAQRIMALNWTEEMDVAQVVTALPPGTKSDTVRRALNALADDGELVKDDSQPRRVLYRLPESGE